MRHFIALGLLLPLMSAQAAVYKCKDAAGKMQYQDRPCSGAQKPAAFNSSARNITGIDSEAARREEAGYLGSREEVKAERKAYDPDQDFQAISAYRRERDRLDSEIARSRDGGIRRHGETRPHGESDHQRLLRERRNLEAKEIARKNGAAFVLEQAPVVAPTPPRTVSAPPPPVPSAPAHRRIMPDPSGLGLIRDNTGDRYRVDGAGRLINRDTNQFCRQSGSKVICQ